MNEEEYQNYLCCKIRRIHNMHILKAINYFILGFMR